MRILLLGAGGFIGTNLVVELAKNKDNIITVVDRNEMCFLNLKRAGITEVKTVISELAFDTNFDQLLDNQEIVYHLVSSTVPTTSNKAIPEELKANVVMSSYLLEACVHKKIKKIVFISSGGTVYGKESKCPLKEETPTYPITSYGIQKITIEKLLYLYNYLYGLDYRIIRLSNPYGPYQRFDGVQGAVTTFIYKAIHDEEITVYGDGSVVRDFIYIDDAIRGIKNIVDGEGMYRTYNLGCGYGTSIKQVLEAIEKVLKKIVKVKFMDTRRMDVPINFLDISRYEKSYGVFNPLSLEEGIKKTALFINSID